jgi:hypothetical protein
LSSYYSFYRTSDWSCFSLARVTWDGDTKRTFPPT